jgi:hypothetical protein
LLHHYVASATRTGDHRLSAPDDPTCYNFASPTFLDGSGLRFNAGAAQNIAFFHQDGILADQYRVNGKGTISAFQNASSSLAAATGGVPEPAAWALMILGAGAIGVAMHRRREVKPQGHTRSKI